MLIREACFVLCFLPMFCLSEFQFCFVAAAVRDLRLVDRRLLGSRFRQIWAYARIDLTLLPPEMASEMENRN